MSPKTIMVIVIPLLVLALGSITTMHPARGNSMNLYDYNHYWNICVQPWSTSGNQYLYSNAGPYGYTWVVTARIGLNGGDNIQHANFYFTTFDDAQGNIAKGYFGTAQSDWIQQGTSVYGSITASFAHGIYLVLFINNSDSAAQCFNVYVSLWYY